ncbi:MAG: histidine kinase dimerization/phospho-acceptor domain-containing protein [candidate division Zixibacteria bacterium]|nr:histidine kinase dimerization/phospho-acceptor domain-containing protein [candidate division Zixibacteria bacterium]
MKQNSTERFDIVRQLALAASRGDRFEQLAETAITQASELVGLKAATLIFWDEDFTPTLTVSHASKKSDHSHLMELEKSLFEQLRKDRQLVSAFLSFGGDAPQHSFTLPLTFRKKSFGAVIGLQEGNRTIVSEEDFLETLSALITLHYVAGSATGDKEDFQGILDKERLSGILDMAVTVNHEVNNPLQAILASVQLLLMSRKDLDDELKKKLQIIEEAAMKIGNITQKLTKITSPRSVKYLDGTTMVDLPDNNNQDGGKDDNSEKDSSTDK